MLTPVFRYSLLTCATLALACSGTVARGAAATPPTSPARDHGVDVPMLDDPDRPAFTAPKTLDPRTKAMWLQALDQPAADLRFQTCAALSEAQARGATGLSEFAPRLRALLMDAHQPEDVQLAAARALIALDMREAGADLLTRNAGGTIEMTLGTDAGLARWKSAGAGELWLARLKNPATPERILRSAIRALGEAGIREAEEPLAKMLFDVSRRAATRLLAAQALATLKPAQAVSLAQPLASGTAKSDHLLAATLLSTASEPPAAALLETLARAPDPAVASLAITRLFTIAPDSLIPLTDALTIHPDVPIREVAVGALLRRKSLQDISVLAKFLGDPAPSVRAAAREALITLDADPALRPAVRARAIEQLAGQEWRSLEQAALVLGSIHEVAALPRLLELMEFNSGEVRIAAHIALRRLGQPESLPRQLKRAQTLDAQLRATRHNMPGPSGIVPPVPGTYEELAQIIQSLGTGKSAPAEPFLRSLVPMNPDEAENIRAAAIWALGAMRRDRSDAGLVDVLRARLSDPLDAPLVRAMSAMSLGRMRSRAALPDLQNAYNSQHDEIGAAAARWAIGQITGTLPPQTEPTPVFLTDWFLEPMR